MSKLSKKLDFFKALFGNLRLNFFEVSFIYIVFTSIVSQFLISSEFMRSVLSLPVFLLLPYLFGELLFFLGNLLNLANYRDITPSSKCIITWFLGFFSIIVLVMLLQMANLYFVVQNLYLAVIVCAFFVIVLNRIFQFNCFNSFNQTVEPLRNRYLFLAALFGLSVVFVVKSLIPFPLPGTGFSDMFFQPLIRLQVHGYVTPFYVRAGDFIVQSLIIQLYNIQPHSLFWIGSFLMVPIFSVGIYYLAKDLTSNSYVGVLSALFAAFINIRVTSQSLFYGTPVQHFRSENIIFALFPISLVLVNRTLLQQKYTNKQTLKRILICGFLFLGTYLFLNSSYTAPENFGFAVGAREQFVSPIFFLFVPLLLFGLSRIFRSILLSDITLVSLILFTFYFFHKESSIIFSFYLLGYLFLHTLVRSDDSRIQMLTKICIGLVLLYVFVQAVGILSIPTTNPFSGFLNPVTYKLSTPVDSFQLKFDSLITANELPTLALLVIGIPSLFLSNKTKRLLPLTLFCFSLLLYFLPDQWSYRAYQILTPTMAIVLGHSVYWMYTNVSSKKRFYNLFFGMLFVLVIVPSLVLPVFQRFSNFPAGNNYYSLMTEEEYELALWLRYNVSEHTIVLSDYKTMQMLVPISNKLWPVSPYCVWMYENEDVLEFMGSVRNRVFLSTNDSDREVFLSGMPDQLFWMEERYLEATGVQDVKIQVIVLLTSRTSEWLSNKNIINEPLSSSGNVSSSHLGILTESSDFRTIYAVEGEIYALLFEND